MRVITGSARGRRLETLPGEDIVRPTTGKVKEAMFSILQFQLPGRKILDLFAGCGQLGIEALSRGAESATFVDSSRYSFEVIKRNLTACGFFSSAKVLQMDALQFLNSKNEKYDIVLLDPPYRAGLAQQALPLLPALMNDGGVILCETALEEELPAEIGTFAIDREYRYGKIKLTSYRLKSL